ncbi:hypothetical protein AB0N17_36545 [Streptomyces sp. NPDC051133]|uniref:hypothetical protein n=1 Tax=Streptomyces sp. NPDC051133 TaxID=3155521 RepID=UPI0034204B5A
MATYTPPRPFLLPDAHLPNSASTPWTCRTCTGTWPCDTAEPYLTAGRCQCGSPTYWEKSKPRRWHTGPRCYSHADQMAALAEELHQHHQAHPHYPPSRPAPPKRRRRQRPPYAHTPSGPGDIRPGAWLWVKPGGLHPAWGDIHRLAMLTYLDRPYCEVWLDDTTVHRVRPHLLILERTPVVNAARAAGATSLVCGSGPSPRPLLPQWRWLDWTLTEHIEHLDADPEPQAEPVQKCLFTA